MEMICERRKRSIGISSGVLWIEILFSRIILVPQARPTIIVRPKVSHILFNSKSSEVLPAKTSGTRKKRA